LREKERPPRGLALKAGSRPGRQGKVKHTHNENASEKKEKLNL
jgi:hypothetical protein